MKPRITTSSIWKSAAWRRATLNSLLGRAGSARGAWAVFARPFTEAGPLRRGQQDWLAFGDHQRMLIVRRRSAISGADRPSIFSANRAPCSGGDDCDNVNDYAV